MGYGFNRQEESRVAGRIAAVNAKRIIFASLVGIPVVFVLALIFNLLAVSGAVTFANIALIGLLGLFVSSFLLANKFVKAHETEKIRIMTRVFWALFEGFALLLSYADAASGGKMFTYTIMLAVLCLVPVMSSTEKIYYHIVQGTFAIFVNVVFNAAPVDYCGIVFLNALFIAASVYESGKIVAGLVASERAKDAKNLEAIDKLTGLLNKKGFDKRTEIAVDHCIQARKRMSIIMFDIDDLQQYNNSFGSDRGNFLIRQIAEIISVGCGRDTDIVCRHSGGKFICYIDGRDEAYAAALGDKIRAVVEGKRIAHGRRASYPYVTLSVGIASGVPVDETDIDRFCDDAEDYLYGAKENGKNCTVCEELVYGTRRRSGYEGDARVI